MSAGSLMDPGFLARLERITLRARHLYRGERQGERRSPRSGAGLEFAGHRGYVAGDDLRHLDWALLGRLDRPFMKTYEERTELAVNLLVDATGSMGFGEPSKFLAAARMTAALGYIALCSLDRVAVGTFAGDGVRLHGPARGKGGLFPLLGFLERSRPDRPPGLAAGLRHHAAASRPGVTVIFSDFFDPRYETMLHPHHARRHSVTLVQVLAPEELDPEIDGDVALSDGETGEKMELTVGDRERAAYRARLDTHRDEMAELARRRGMDFVSIGSGVPLEDAVWDHLLRRTALTGRRAG